MADYNKEEIKRLEEKWRREWETRDLYKVDIDTSKPKYYVLDMFPYPSGAGLHVGHPLGYIASDIVARYKRLKGFNVLHPMGFDAFGLPAEQYAIQTGQHPRITTEKNIQTYKRQLKQIGFSFDWDREVQTSDPKFYQWTQWIFMQLFNAWYNKKALDENKNSIPEGSAEPIITLIAEFELNGNKNVEAACDDETPLFTAEEWRSWDIKKQEDILQKYRIAYRSETMVNWCPGLGTVLSNDEVKDGVSERGGYPVERIRMWQWSMRISAYAERLLNGLDTIDWPEPVKEMQRNWIGKSVGCELDFKIENTNVNIRVFTTRIDTIYGVTFMVLAPEHEVVEKITTPEQRDEVMKYVDVAKNRSERERMSEVKRISGVFTGAYVINPFNNEKVPVWIADYVLAGYGTGAVMAVPSSDTRDYAFAKHFSLPIIDVLEGPTSDITKDNFDPKSGTMINSDILNGLTWNEAIEKALQKVEALGIGKRKVNYRMRDAIFGRQRYWGEPFPVYYKDDIPYLVEEDDLPITLPEIDEYKPTESGEPPLARAREWRYHLTPALSRGEGAKPERKDRVAQDYIFTTDEKTWKALKTYAREHRKNPTNAEQKMWHELRNSKLGVRFRRQHAIEQFIVDFVCIEKKLVVEIDGEIHNFQREADDKRTKVINEAGFHVIRFNNDEVIKNISSVLDTIKKTISLSSGEGRGEVTYPFELTTMPGWAGSSWYWYRYMDPHNEDEFCSKEAESYWKDVDLYIGGSEHATGHLMYSRFWNKALKDLGYVEAEEPFKKLINQGHIQGVSSFIQYIDNELIFEIDNHDVIKSAYISFGKQEIEIGNKRYELPPQVKVSESRIPTSEYIDEKGRINETAFYKLKQDTSFNPFYQNFKDVAWEVDEKGEKYISVRQEIEKMSKSKHNVVNPDDIVDNYGADTLRMYEMFLGPLELSKPWNTNGIDGVYKFLRRFWNLFHDNQGKFTISDTEPSREELKVLHKTIKKVEEDIDRFSFNTSVSEFMICVNELTALKCNKRAILEPLVIILSPFAPHIAEELWQLLGHKESVLKASYPAYDEQYLVENSFEYPISINGKVRMKMNFALDMPKEDIEKLVLASDTIKKWTEGKPPKKIIIVPGRIVNVVV